MNDSLTELLINISNVIAADIELQSSDILNQPASDHEVYLLRQGLRCSVPAELTDLLKIANGEKTVDSLLREKFNDKYREYVSLFLDFPFYSTARIITEYNNEREVEELQLQPNRVSSYPRGVVKETSSNKNYVPIGGTESIYFSIDQDPGPEGESGQVILHGHEIPCNIRLANGLNEFLSLIYSHYVKGDYVKKGMQQEDSDFVRDVLIGIN